jgi:hypothetical protein
MASLLCTVAGQTDGNDEGCTWPTVVVSVLVTGPKGCGFEPGQGDGYF